MNNPWATSHSPPPRQEKNDQYYNIFYYCVRRLLHRRPTLSSPKHKVRPSFSRSSSSGTGSPASMNVAAISLVQRSRKSTWGRLPPPPVRMRLDAEGTNHQSSRPQGIAMAGSEGTRLLEQGLSQSSGPHTHTTHPHLTHTHTHHTVACSPPAPLR